MALRRGLFLPRRPYATVRSPLFLAKPPVPPPHASNPRPLDRSILESLANTPSAGRTALPQLIEQYLDRSGNILDAQLLHEPCPSPSRRVSFSTDEGSGVHLIAHVVRESDRSKITVSSGITLETSDGQSVLVTCAHTLEEVCRLPVYCIWARIADVRRSVGLRCSSSLMRLTILHSLPYPSSLMRALRAHSSFRQSIQPPRLIPLLQSSPPFIDLILSYYPHSLCGHHSVHFQYRL